MVLKELGLAGLFGGDVQPLCRCAAFVLCGVRVM